METENKSTQKAKQGIVTSNKMMKTVVVEVSRTFRHPRYSKVMTRKKKYYAHNDLKPLEIGDKVTIVETRPLSKLKRWRVVES